jgi:hypothetical protein
MIDKTKQYKTRDGREVRIYATDGRENFEVHGAVKTDDGWQVVSWSDDGKFYPHSEDEHKYDLIEVKPRIKRTVWILCLSNGLCALFHSKHIAETYSADNSYVQACVKVEIDCEEGEGL